MTSRDRLDIHQAITDQIIAALEAGVADVQLPWHRTGAYSIMPRNASSGAAYHGINVFSLLATLPE